MIHYLSLEDLLTLAGDLEVGPVRDVGLLDSAAYRPQASVFGVEAYPSLDVKAGVLLESVVRNHALVDGNKRLSLAALIAFVGINGFLLDFSNDQAHDVIYDIASGARDDVHDIAERLRVTPIG